MNYQYITIFYITGSAENRRVHTNDLPDIPPTEVGPDKEEYLSDVTDSDAEDQDLQNLLGE